MKDMPVMAKKGKDELQGFNIRILDDGSFLVREEHSDYSKCKEFSCEDYEEVMVAMKILSRKGKKEEKGEKEDDELTKKVSSD